MNDVLLLIDQLDDMIRNAPSGRLGADVRLPRVEVFQLVDRMRARMPEELGNARWIAEHRTEMLQEARQEADRIVAGAREERERILGEAALGKLAEQRAEKILESARARARQIRLGTDGYADEILAGLETGLTRFAAATQAQR